ncbi:hypothetical protein M3Y99_01583100 [Aphelenchoides fujianensis]|nr:hypothetical protein M3Y99_01583100 [Aphelenchoides fujianensis]
MGAEWIQTEILRTVATQRPEVAIRNVLFLGQPKDYDEVGGDIRSFFNGKATVEQSEATGLATIASSSHQLVILFKQLASADATQLNALPGEVLHILSPNGIAVVCEEWASLSAQQIAELSTTFDSFEAEVGGERANLKVYCMNQFEAGAGGPLGFFWLLERKAEEVNDENNEKMTGSWLDKTQYLPENIRAYEWIFGENFISPGGIEQNRHFLSKFHGLAEGKRMLDIGCGIGGSPRQAAAEHGLSVWACDISANMIAFAIEKAGKAPDRRVHYQLCDAVQYKYEPESFDYVYSRDCVQHISELPRLFANIYNCLKPGGEFLVTMYGKGHGELTVEFLQYVHERKYDLHNLQQVVEMAKTAGFQKVEGENITQRFQEILFDERQKAVDKRAEFMDRFSEKKYEGLLSGWEQKLRFIRDDNHNWLLLKCTK